MKSNAEALEHSIRDLRSLGMYEQALPIARKLLVLRRHDPQSRPWQRTEAAWAVRTLSVAVALPARGRRDLAWADRTETDVAAAYAEGRYAEGLELIERQTEIRGRLLSSEHPEFARSLGDAAVLRLALGEMEPAETLLRQSMEKVRATLGQEHPALQGIRNNLASVLQAKGDHAGAEPLLREALVVWRKTLGNDTPVVAGGLNNLAVVRKEQGDYAGAEALCREALAIWRRLLGEVHPDVATCLENLAQILQRKGDRAGAKLLYQEALEMKRNLLGPDHPYVAFSLSNLAVILQEAEDPLLHRDAERCYLDALAIARNQLGQRHPFVATLLNNLAVLLLRMGEVDEAEVYQRESLEIYRHLHGEEHPDHARGLRNLASILRAQGDLAGAEELCLAALARQERLLGPAHPELARSFGELGRVRWARGDVDAAESAILDQARVFENARVHAGCGVERVTFQRSPYIELALIRLHQGHHHAAWEAAERASARSLGDALRSSEAPSLRAEDERVEEERVEEGPRRAIDEWAGFEGCYDLQRIQRHILEGAAIVGWVQADAELPGTSSWGYVIRPDGPVAWEKIPSIPPAGPGAGARDPLTDFRRYVAEYGQVAGGEVSRGRAAAADCLQPLLPHLDGIRELIVIPSAPMLGLPVEAVAVETVAVETVAVETSIGERAVRTGAGRSRRKLMIDRFAVSYTPSATIHAWLSERQEARSRSESGSGNGSGGGNGSGAGSGNGSGTSGLKDPHRPLCLAIGDPSFGRDADGGSKDTAGDSVIPAARTVARKAKRTGARIRGGPGTLDRLPSTRSEVDFVVRCHAPGSKVMVGEEATERELARSVRSGELRRYDTIHIATHALIDAYHPERSALVLSQLDLPSPLEAAIHGDRMFGGCITAGAIARDWKIDADLVTLSACETGLGRNGPDEGYIGLAQAFFQAGARSVLASLWKVDDSATCLLMRRFYENWLGSGKAAMSKASALRDAKRSLRRWRDDDGRRRFAHPFFWAGFVLIGAGR